MGIDSTWRKAKNIGKTAIKATPVGYIGSKYLEDKKTSEQAPIKAAQIQADYGKQGLGLQREMFQQGRQDTQPWRQAGALALKNLQRNMGAGKYSMPTEEFDASQYAGPGQFDKSQYQIPGAFDASRYQGPGQFDESKYAGPGAFDKSQYQMPGEFSFTANDFESSPYYEFLQNESARGVNRSAAAGGGLGAGATGVELGDRAQAIAGREFGNQYNRALGTHQQNLGQAMDERNFGYGQNLDEIGRSERDRGFGYNQYQDSVGRSERDRGFGYTQHLGDVGQAERERGFGYGQNLDEQGQSERDRGFGYQNFQGSYGRRAGGLQDEYNRYAAMSGTGQTTASGMANLGQNYGNQGAQSLQGIGNVLGAGQVGAANAQQQFWNNLFNMGGQLGGAAIGKGG